MPTPDQMKKAKGDTPNTELETAAKKLSVPAGTAAAEKTGGANTPETPSILDSLRSNKKAANANAIMQDPALSQSVISEKTGAQMPFLGPEAETPTVAPVPVPEPSPVAPVQQEITPSPPMADAQAKATSGGLGTTVDTASVLQEIKKDPSIGEQIMKLAKDTGTSVLELIQGFAKGYSGSDIPLASQVRQKEKEAKQQQQHELEVQDARVKADQLSQQAQQQFQTNLQSMQNAYNDKIFAATSQREKEQLANEQAFQADQQKKQLDMNMKIAQIMRTPTMWDQAGGLQKALADALAGGKVK